MNQKYIVLTIVTTPIDTDQLLKKTPEEKQKLINPIDSMIIGIGIRYQEKNIIFSNQNEKEILNKFWEEWKNIKKDKPAIPTIGFNINNFDIPFLVGRSYINNIKIYPFSLKEIIDIRQKIQAYKPGKTRGKLKEYGDILGITINIDNNQIPNLYKNKNFDKINEYIDKTLELIDSMYKRAQETNIIKINKY
ncbi:MAG TPA: 3'-5' exonuclease [Candidatus Diapherotrites archaeon]|jgi:hypothetical protein|nr:3'-5' exonuclease [Candidatus Diapherotrites archaeon]